MGTARVRVVHAGSDAPTVGIDVGNDSPNNPEIPSLARFADTGPDGAALPSGQSLQLGIDANGQAVTAFTTPALPDGADLFVIATGLLGALPRDGSGFGLLVVGPSGSVGFIRQNPVVYALHASPDAPAVDVYAGNTELITNLSFGQISAPLQVPPNTYMLDFFGHSSTAGRPAGMPATTQSTGALAAGNRYLAVATGFLAPKTSTEPHFQLDAYEDDFSIDSANARVRIVHASPTA